MKGESKNRAFNIIASKLKPGESAHIQIGSKLIKLTHVKINGAVNYENLKQFTKSKATYNGIKSNYLPEGGKSCKRGE